MIEYDLAALGAMGQMARHLYALRDLENRLGQAPLWGPSHALVKQTQEAQRLIAQMQARLDRRLIVTLIGPSGSGKSTLLNALAGVDDLSPTGRHRPTTQELVVLASDAEAVAQWFEPLESNQLQIRTSRAAEALTHLILVDTPDTDSTQADRHWPLIEHAVARSDVLICVFDAQNPKRRDHADFMAPLVRRFHGASLVAVANQCDRLEARELTEVILPEFDTFLRQAWDTPPQRLLATSARRHLQAPRWEPQAGPRHAVDQFDELRDLIFNAFNQPGFGADRRLANARQIVEFMQEQVRQAVENSRSALAEAADKITVAGQHALGKAMESLRSNDSRLVLGVHVRLYQALAQRWVGPVGWLVAIWSRLILFGTGLVALVKLGNPIRQIFGLISAWRRYKEGSAALESLNNPLRVDSALQQFQRTWWTLWPDIAERLIQGGFAPQVRRMEMGRDAEAGILVRDLWNEALDAEIERRANGLSHFLLQAVFNLPPLGLLGYVGWLTASRFLTGQYLAGDFFMHALLSTVIVLLLCFFLLQAAVRLTANRDRIQERAFQSVRQSLGDHPMVAGREVAEQARLVLALAVDREVKENGRD
ncbi:MAG: 50S ribosome-binding GTPase [Desulfobacteraceae bacterium]|nr:50S ribosome-binding GTPase [Desulfobacteraceae bacterium]